MGSFCKSLKIEKTIAYAFNNVLLNWSITKEGLRLECFVNFLDDPYYEPLLWFMIEQVHLLMISIMKYFKSAPMTQRLPEPTSSLKPLNLVKTSKSSCHYAPSSLAWPHHYFGAGDYWVLLLQAIMLCAKKCSDHVQLAPSHNVLYCKVC